MEPGASRIEQMLGVEFTSDPRLSKHPLPETPEGAPAGVSYVHSGYVLTPEVAKDWLTHRVIRQEVMPPELLHDEVTPNRKFLIHYLKTWMRKLENGEWNKGTHQGAAFTPDGFLLDCQHRMAACVLAKTPIILPVSVNTPWSAFMITDSSRRRAADQMLGDLPYGKQAVAVVRHLLPVLNGTSLLEWTVRGFEDDVVNICLGWPYFAEDQVWMREICETANFSGVPSAPLGAACIGALAAGADPFQVQAFLDGLRPAVRDVEYEALNGGEDPRRLLLRLFQTSARRDAKGRFNAEDQRANTGVIRTAMNLWLERYEEGAKHLKQISRTPPSRDLPPMYREDAVRAFHNKHVN